ncbi:hypothetical protein MKW98_026429 [Papaver atlanticum]|uniref:Uncharacterized protein n=1 Tax=Papaver atlanticum TaxID=357466 RepID=A0AAD4TDJ4_9MAGN|nr:hypothetical protein MKW98_026429 [Papaver atlanticum]
MLDEASGASHFCENYSNKFGENRHAGISFDPTRRVHWSSQSLEHKKEPCLPHPRSKKKGQQPQHHQVQIQSLRRRFVVPAQRLRS